MLEATLREHGPAPVPSSVRLAQGPAFPPAPPPPTPILASFGGRAPPQPPAPGPRGGARAMSFAEPVGMDGTAQFLNGRGLY
jgi:hypothetical protein